jgi:hypothetical protein
MKNEVKRKMMVDRGTKVIAEIIFVTNVNHFLQPSSPQFELPRLARTNPARIAA